ncbi:unnamed protein product [Macrosiphum euphorbiae]|uniref:Uncharacterized protein n=1 Tax=Macrosiphum euphorbiae TaxID=13131 RepID=A0AAV0VHZ8_9HEMI|nr:unnamed protein product [Macrosiphum euphorbiae]
MDRGKFTICMVFVFSLVIGGDRSVEAQNSQKNNVSEIYETVSSIKLPSQDICGRTNVTHNRTVGRLGAELGSVRTNACFSK